MATMGISASNPSDPACIGAKRRRQIRIHPVDPWYTGRLATPPRLALYLGDLLDRTQTIVGSVDVIGPEDPRGLTNSY